MSENLRRALEDLRQRRSMPPKHMTMRRQPELLSSRPRVTYWRQSPRL
jgi:hypothetical protein